MQSRKKPSESSRFIRRMLRLSLPLTQLALTQATYSEMGTRRTHADYYVMLLFSVELVAFVISTEKAFTALLGKHWEGSRGFTRSQYAMLISQLLSSMLCAAYFISTLLENEDYDQSRYYWSGLIGALGTLLNQSVECSASLFHASKHNLSFKDAFEEINYAPECTIM